jgi:hypothetical protein
VRTFHRFRPWNTPKKNPEELTVRVHRFHGLPQLSALPRDKTKSLSGRPSVSAASSTVERIRAAHSLRDVSIYHGQLVRFKALALSAVSILIPVSQNLAALRSGVLSTT